MSKYNRFEIKYVETYDEEAIVFQWGIEGIGFGEIGFHYKDGKLKCDNEGMSKEFIKTILCDFVDRAELENKKED